MFYRICTVLVCSMVCLLGCDQPDRSVRHYREINFAEKNAFPEPAASMAPHAGSGMGELPPEMQTPALPLTWATPDGWAEVKGSGMRVVTFTVEGLECSVLTFPGDVGGDEANITRWLGQLGVDLPHDIVHQFTDRPTIIKTAGGFECRFFDFANILPEGTENNMLAGIIPVGEHTAFVKMMGDAKALESHKTAFISLCESIGMKQP